MPHGSRPAVPAGALWVPKGPGLPNGLVIGAGELVERFSKSSGPGGQHINTTDTRVEVTFDAHTSSALTESERDRIGTLRVVVSTHRSQWRNRTEARRQLAELIQAALAPPPPPRVPTKPSKNARRRRVDAKKRRGQTKSLRGRVRE